MSNPWLHIPLHDYEAHMASPAVGQAPMLADQFERLLARYRPASVAVIGCSGGNGFERIDPRTIERLVAVDINRTFVEAVALRHADRFRRLELYCADVQSESLRFDPVDLIYAGLLFEYVDPVPALKNMKRLLREAGALAVMLQLPHAGRGVVSASPYRSLNALTNTMRLVAPQELCRRADEIGFAPIEAQFLSSPSGKPFACLSFRDRAQG